MDNKAKIRYWINPKDDLSIEFEILWIDESLQSQEITLPMLFKALGFDLITNKLQTIQFQTMPNRNLTIKMLHMAIVKLITSNLSWTTIWYWTGNKVKKTIDVGIDVIEVTPGQWLPWSPDMPIPKPRALGNSTFEV